MNLPGESSKPDDLIFGELASAGPETEEGTRVWNLANSKLWYLTPEQAQAFLDLENNGTYKKAVTDIEIALIKQHLPQFISQLPEHAYNLVDLGCGNGEKAALVMASLKGKSLRYCPIDLSAFMVDRATETVRKKMQQVLRLPGNVSDFENLADTTPLFRDKDFQHHIIMLLGNTLGNFESTELLHTISKSMKAGDGLIIGNGLNTLGPEKIGEAYQGPLIDRFHMLVLEQLGFKKEEVEFFTRVKDSQVEMCYRIKTTKKINRLGKEIEIQKGDIIIVAISRRYSPQRLQEDVARFFGTTMMHTDEEKSYALLFCKK